MSHTLQALQPFITHLLPPTRVVRLTEVTMESAKVCLQLTTTAVGGGLPALCCTLVLGAQPLSAPPDGPALGPAPGPHPAHGAEIRLPKCDCTRRIFTERVPELVAAYARKTYRLIAALQAIGVALGGQAGARLAHRLGLPVSRDTLLRLVRRLPLPVIPPPRAIGVDDWAYRKRQRYGTIVVDFERRQPVALLHDREAETLADWLREHPSVTIIARDRLKAYQDGARAGAPQATQVADRFHLLQNLAEALDQVFSAHGHALKAVSDMLSRTPSSSRMARPPYWFPRVRRRRRLRPGRRNAGRGGSPPMNRSGRSTVRGGRIGRLPSNSALVV